MLQSFWMLLAAACFAVMGAFVKLASAQVGLFEIVFWRSALGLAFIWAWVLARGLSPRTNYLFGHLKRSICGTLAFTMWFATFGYLPLGTSTTLNYTSPLFIAATTMIIARRHGRRAPWALTLAIVIGFIGVCLVLRPSLTPDQVKWALLGLSGASLSPIIFFQIKELGNLREPSWRIVFYFSLVGTVWGLAGCLAIHGGLGGHQPLTWVWLIGVGVSAVVAQVCMTRAFAYGNMMLTACFQFATIPLAELISTFFFHESLPLMALCGMGLILIAGSAASVITRRMEQAPPAGP